MNLDENERRFVAKRRKMMRVWPQLGAIVLSIGAAGGLWLYWANPLLVNPYLVLARLRDGSLPPATLTLMAGLLPLPVWACLLLVIALAAMLYASAGQEKKYLAIIERHIADDQR